MSVTGKRRVAEEPEKSVATKEDAKTSRNRHRSTYPTPGFKAFAALLNIISIPLGSLQLNSNSNISVLMLCLLALVGSGVAVYSNLMRPKADNVQLRKLLTGVSAGLGLFTLLALAATYLIFA